MKRKNMIYYLLTFTFLLHSGEVYSSSKNKCELDFEQYRGKENYTRFTREVVKKNDMQNRLKKQKVFYQEVDKRFASVDNLKETLLKFLVRNPKWIVHFVKGKPIDIIDVLDPLSRVVIDFTDPMSQFFREVIMPSLNISSRDKLLGGIMNLTEAQHKEIFVQVDLFRKKSEGTFVIVAELLLD